MSSDGQPVSNPYAPPAAQLEVADVARDQAYLLPCSPAKLVVLSLATFNLYFIYWFWMNFRHEQRRNPDISVVLRTIFSGIFFYTLARGAADEADSRGLPSGYSPGVLTGLLWLFAVGSNQLPEPWSLLVFLMVLVLLPVQLTVNRINRDISPHLRAAEGFRGWEIAIAVPGSLLLLLAIVGTLLG